MNPTIITILIGLALLCGGVVAGADVFAGAAAGRAEVRP